MTSHRQIMVNMATAVMNDADVRDYCIEHFGRGLQVCVGAYPSGIPSEDDSPFLWIYANGENESVNVDAETFSAEMVVGGCVRSENDEQMIVTEVAPRTATDNGLIVNGGNKVIEDLRDLILEVVRGAANGAIVSRFRRVENDISHFPLEWASVIVEFNDFQSL